MPLLELDLLCMVLAFGFLMSLTRMIYSMIGRVSNSVDKVFWFAIFYFGLSACESLSPPKVDVLTQRYDSSRNAVNSKETELNLQTLGGDRFGKIFERTVEGAIYAQPLLVSGLEIKPNELHDVVYVSTMNNQVLAFDASSPGADRAIWGPVTLGPAVTLPDPCIANSQFRDIAGQIGIMSTPVIDRVHHYFYVVHLEKAAANTDPGTFDYRYVLTQLDIRDGKILNRIMIANTVNQTRDGCFPINATKYGACGISK